jgi:hypothetical protein
VKPMVSLHADAVRWDYRRGAATRQRQQRLIDRALVIFAQTIANGRGTDSGLTTMPSSPRLSNKLLKGWRGFLDGYD